MSSKDRYYPTHSSLPVEELERQLGRAPSEKFILLVNNRYVDTFESKQTLNKAIDKLPVATRYRVVGPDGRDINYL